MRGPSPRHRRQEAADSGARALSRVAGLGGGEEGGEERAGGAEEGAAARDQRPALAAPRRGAGRRGWRRGRYLRAGGVRPVRRPVLGVGGRHGSEAPHGPRGAVGGGCGPREARCGRRGRQDFPTRLLGSRAACPHFAERRTLKGPGRFPRALGELQARGLLGSRLAEL